jgi:hypothetical protein
MSLRSDLQTMGLPDVLQFIAAGRKTGTLHLERGSVKKRIIVREGTIFSSWSNDPRESLGQFLIRLGLVTEEQLFKALLAQEERNELIGSILIEDGILTEYDLKRALKVKAEESLYDLFLWPSGHYEFKEGEVPPDIRITYETPVTPVILEGVRRVDEWSRIKEVFPNMETSFRTTVAASAPVAEAEKRVLALAAGGRTIAEISLEIRCSEFETAALLFELHKRGLVEVDESRAVETPSDPVGAIHALLALAQERLEEKRFDAARKAYEDVLSLDRLNQHAKKGLIATLEARQQEKALTTVPQEAVPVLAVELADLTSEKLDPQEGFVLSRVNGEWDVQSILKLCPMGEEATLLIFARLLERGLIRLQ